MAKQRQRLELTVYPDRSKDTIRVMLNDALTNRILGDNLHQSVLLSLVGNTICVKLTEPQEIGSKCLERKRADGASTCFAIKWFYHKLKIENSMTLPIEVIHRQLYAAQIPDDF